MHNWCKLDPFWCNLAQGLLKSAQGLWLVFWPFLPLLGSVEAIRITCKKFYRICVYLTQVLCMKNRAYFAKSGAVEFGFNGVKYCNNDVLFCFNDCVFGFKGFCFITMLGCFVSIMPDSITTVWTVVLFRIGFTS